MKILAPLFRFVDWDLRRTPATTAGNLTILVAILPWLAIVLVEQQADKPTSNLALVLVFAFDAIWFALVGWRAWRLFRQFAERNDRLYDRSGKYVLPPEYADTESATKARRRSKNVS
jgi:hypothetical protein